MSPVHKLSQMGSITTNKIDYPSMLAGYGDFGALQRIGYFISTGSQIFTNFTNIPQTFQDLRIVIFGRTTNSVADDFLALNFQSDYNSNYSATQLSGNGSSASSTRATNQTRIFDFPLVGATSTSGIFSALTIDILNYRSSSFKTVIGRWAYDKNGSGSTGLCAGLYRSTTAINEINCNVGSGNGNWASGSTVALYGVKASAA